jgi:osmoprotectant transport system permease protein
MSDDPTNVWAWFADSSQRTVSGSIPSQLWTTLFHSLTAFAIACAIAIPLAAWLAHRGGREVVAGWIVNLGRVIPTITILGFAVLISLRNGYGFEPWPIIFALVALALPPLFANTYTAVREASPDAVSAARAIGMSEGQILRGVELPLALPLILAAGRVTLTQVVATEALGALFGSGGLGIYVRFGFANSDVVQIQAGALLVAGTAMAVDLVAWLAIRYGLPKGLRPPDRRRSRTGRARVGRRDLTLIPNHQPLRGTP